MARFAPLYEVPVADATADVRGRLSATEKYDVDDAPPYFQAVTVAISIESAAPPARVAQLVAHAERACHAAQTLRHGVPVHLEPRLNGVPFEIPDEGTREPPVSRNPPPPGQP